MDGNGVIDLVEAKASADYGELPVRGRSCSCNAMPLLRQKFPTYKEFASSSLEGIYTDSRLDMADKVTATEFESGIWTNESSAGSIRFEWKPFPVETQLSPVFGSVAADFFGEQRPSLALTQNHFTREPETGLWRGGLGTLISPSKGDNSFTPIASGESGFVVAGDGKGLAVVDLNGDNRPDVVAAQNNDAILAFQVNSKLSESPLTVKLVGKVGNPLAFGARVFLINGEKTIQTAEIHGGSGYLSQSTSTVFFSRTPNAESPFVVKVVWPTGQESSVPVDPNQNSIRISELEN
jgi:hypothetical protein